MDNPVSQRERERQKERKGEKEGRIKWSRVMLRAPSTTTRLIRVTPVP